MLTRLTQLANVCFNQWQQTVMSLYTTPVHFISEKPTTRGQSNSVKRQLGKPTKNSESTSADTASFLHCTGRYTETIPTTSRHGSRWRSRVGGHERETSFASAYVRGCAWFVASAAKYMITALFWAILRCLVCIVVVLCVLLSCVYCCCLVCIVVVLCVLLSSYVHLLYYVFTLDAGLLARSQYSEGPATGHLNTSFSRFPCVYKQMLIWFPRFQVATTCFSCSRPDLNLLVTNFIFCIHVK